MVALTLEDLAASLNSIGLELDVINYYYYYYHYQTLQQINAPRTTYNKTRSNWSR
jgi:hypothetical protein